jgi:hypothetical protein
VTTTTNCLRANRGAIIGLLQAAIALTGAFFAEIYEGFGLSIPGFLLFVALFGTGTLLLAYPSNHTIVNQEENYVDPVSIIPLAAFLLLCCLLIIAASIEETNSLYLTVSVLFMLFICFVGVLSNMMLARYGQDALRVFEFEKNATVDQIKFLSVADSLPSGTPIQVRNMSREGEALLMRVLSDEHADGDDGDGAISDLDDDDNNTVMTADYEGAKEGQDATFMQALCTSDYWMIIFMYGTLDGIGVSVFSSIDYIVDAHSAKDSDDSVNETLKTNGAALFSVFNAIGRVVFGLLSDYLVARQKLSRYVAVSVVALLQMIGVILLAYVTTETNFFNFTMILGGFAFGGSSVLMDAIVLDTFGPTNFGVIVGGLYVGGIIGILVLQDLVMSLIYDHFADETGSCTGRPQCYTLTFWLFAGLSLVCMGFSFKLMMKKQKQ